MTEPKTAAEYLDRGCDKDDQKDSKGAIEDYTKAIELNPNYAEAYANRGCAKEELGDKEGAIADWQKAADLGDEEAAKWLKELNKNKKIVTPKRDAIIRRVDTNDEIEWTYTSLINDKDNQNFSSISKPYLIKDLETTEGANKFFDEFDDEIVEYLASCSGGDIHASENFIEIAIKCGSDLEDPEEIERHYLRSFKEVSDDEDVDFPEAIEVVWVMEETLKPTQLAKFKKELVEHFTNNLESEVMNLSFEYKWGGKKKFDSGDMEGAIADWQKASDLGDEEAAKWIQEVSSKTSAKRHNPLKSSIQANQPEIQEWALVGDFLYAATQSKDLKDLSQSEQAELCGYYYEGENGKEIILDEFQDEILEGKKEYDSRSIKEKNILSEFYFAKINERLCFNDADHGGRIYIPRSCIISNSVFYKIDEWEEVTNEEEKENEFDEPMMFKDLSLMNYADDMEFVEDKYLLEWAHIKEADIHPLSRWHDG